MRKNKMKKRKITAVITSRNDNYGGNLKERAMLCLNHMIHTFDEVIYVDYNSETISLIEEIKDKLDKKGNLKAILVTPEQHLKMVKDKGTEINPMIEVFGRNIGIRKATGDIIVSTNIDIIPPTREVLDTFLNSWYDKEVFYTCARRNVELAKDFNYSLYKFDESVRTTLNKDIRKMIVKRDANDYDRWSRVRCCGDFQLASKNIWFKIKGFEESLIHRGYADSEVQMKSELSGHPVRGIFDLPVFHILHGYEIQATYKINPPSVRLANSRNPETWGFSDVSFKEQIL